MTCDYCDAGLRVDTRGRCRNCGAPEPALPQIQNTIIERRSPARAIKMAWWDINHLSITGHTLTGSTGTR